MGAKPHPLKGEIARLYDSGVTRTAISERLGVSINTVRHYTRDRILLDKFASMPFGNICISRNLTAAQVVTLDKLARKWGCKNLSEAALEILRDYLEEQEQNG